MKNFLKEFNKFVAKGNVIDLAVGLAIGTAFQKIVSSLVNDIIFPAFAPLLNVAQFSDWKIKGILIGSFVKNVADFLIIAVTIFLAVRFFNRFKKKEEKKEDQKTAAADYRQEKLLGEIRDILKEKNK